VYALNIDEAAIPNVGQADASTVLYEFADDGTTAALTRRFDLTLTGN